MNDVPAETIKAIAREYFDRACNESIWADRIGMPELAERLRGKAMGICELRHLLLPFDHGDQNKGDDGGELVS